MLRIHLLGEFRIVDDDAPVAGFHTPRFQSLIGWLLLHAGIPQPRTELAFRFWPDSSEEQAHGNLRKALYDLRHALPHVDPFLCFDRQTVHWREDGPYEVDVTRFKDALTEANSVETIRRTAGIYGGELLPSCYDDWVVPERERLYRAFIGLLKNGIALAEGERDHTAALELAERLQQAEPLQEETYRTLMRLHALSGNRAEALRSYHRCAAMLEQELGIGPSPATKEAFELLLRHETSPPTTEASLPLVGRAREWDLLQALWRTATRAPPQVALLTGEPGIGKTRLAEEMQDWAARQGIATAFAFCFASEGVLAYAPVAALVRSVTLPALEPVWLQELARLLPEVLQKHPDVPPPGPLTEPWQRQRLFEALARALLGRQPLLLMVDDLQWCDQDSLDWLHYLLRFDAGARLLLLCTLRPEGIGAEGERGSLWPGLRRAGQLKEIALEPLDAKATKELAGSVAGGRLDAAALDRIVAETEGNPLFVLETVRAGPQPGTMPPTMRAVLEARLAQLPPEARTLAGVASAIGRTFRFPILARAGGQSEHVVVQALDELGWQRIVREHGGGEYDFSHDKLREVAYAALGSARRLVLHRRIAEALEEIHAGNLDPVSEQLGAHFEKAGAPERAARYYLRAGDLARGVYANETAIAAYRRALGLASNGQRVEITLELVEVYRLVGKWPEAEALCRQALEMADRLGETANRARCLLALGDILRLRGSSAESTAMLERARSAFETLDDQAGLCQAVGLLGRVAWDVAKFPRALELLEEQLQIATRLGDRQSAGNALGNIALVYWHQADIARARSYLEQQLAIAREADDREQICRALCNLAIMLVAEGRYTEALDCLEEQLLLARSIGYMRSVSHALGWMGIVYRHRGELDQALGYLEQQLQMARGMDDRPVQSYTLHEIGIVHEVLGDDRRALTWYLDALRMACESEDLSIAAPIINSLGRIYEHAGDWRRAIQCHTASARIAEERCERLYLGLALGALAGAYVAQGCDGEAELLFERVLASDLPQPYERCECLQQYAELLFRQGRYDDAHRMNDEALRLAREIARADVQNRAEVLAIRLQLALGSIDLGSGIAALEQLLPAWPGSAEHAPIQYEIWRLDGTREAARRTAANAYRELYQGSPRSEYRHRYREMTGEDLLDPPPLPELPEIVTRYTLDSKELFNQLDRMLHATLL